MFIDTHCHLFPEYYENLDEIISKIQDNKISKVINSGCDKISNKIVLEMLGKYSFMYGTIGIHPEDRKSVV